MWVKHLSFIPKLNKTKTIRLLKKKSKQTSGGHGDPWCDVVYNVEPTEGCAE